MSLRLLTITAGLAALSACSGNAAQPADAHAKTSDARPQAPARQVAAEPDGAAIKAIVTSIMDAQYPDGYDAAHSCWKTSIAGGDDALDYCMRPQSPHVVDGTAGRELYFHAANASDINDNLDYAYSSVDSGLMGAFRARLQDDGRFTLLSAAPALEFGTAGDCGCSQAKFRNVSDTLHAWTFVSGGTWQGVVSTNHVIVAPVGKTFADIAGFPEVRESAQDVRYTFDFTPAPGGTFYPVTIVRTQAGHAEVRTTAAFDAATQRYALPSDF